jgi:hypothetical protein
MKFKFLEEPELEFGTGKDIDPRQGIMDYNAYSTKQGLRRDEIFLGTIGPNRMLRKLYDFLDKCSKKVIRKPTPKEKLFPSFPGFNKNIGFKTDFKFGEFFSKDYSESEIKRIIAIKDRTKRIEEAVNLYYEKIKYLAENRSVDVIICINPNELYDSLTLPTPDILEETIEPTVDEEKYYNELDFRRALKAKTMHLGKPIQIIREISLTPSNFQQDEATKIWNFCTAVFYKANHIPWRLPKNENRPSVCFVGISFYKSRDRKVTHTSLAQIFDELGNGVILRGTPVKIDEYDNCPHLEEEQAEQLLKDALSEYKSALESLPARLVIHKSSNYNKVELDGFKNAIYELGITKVDFVTILDTDIKVFRDGYYPIRRGTLLEITENKRYVLYTRGSVDFYQEYPGSYIPQPIEIRIAEGDTSGETICEEILALTKMNWNNTQFDGKYPITLVCARKVGEIMKYLLPHDRPQIKYGFYM